jgi:haloacetate dehalogenase
MRGRPAAVTVGARAGGYARRRAWAYMAAATAGPGPETMTGSPDLFPGFTPFDIGTGHARIHGISGGSGPPVLLLHGFPQTHAIWHRVAPRLAASHTVIATDLTGYGDSGKPPSDAQHSPYSKRSMAADQVRAMRALGHERFHVVGHDRGGRVAHRMALDHPGRVLSLATLDIAPTRDMYRLAGDAFARAYWHWYFLIRPSPVPETLIGTDPAFYLRQHMSRGPEGIALFDRRAFAEYERCFSDPATVHAACEDYRAAATVDLRDDEADLDRRISCPMLALWGEKGAVGRCFDVAALWRDRADAVVAASVPCGHYIPEEAPRHLLDLLLPHLAAAGKMPFA